MKKRKTMTELEAAEQVFKRARAHLAQVQEAHNALNVLPKLMRMIGQYWVYKGNCYSCPTTPSDYWDIYGMVESVDPPHITLITVQIDSHGVTTITRSSAVSWDGNMPAGWTRTTEVTFNAEMNRAKRRLGLEAKCANLPNEAADRQSRAVHGPGQRPSGSWT